MDRDDYRNLSERMEAEVKTWEADPEPEDDDPIMSLTIYLPASRFQEMMSQGIGFTIHVESCRLESKTLALDYFRANPQAFLQWMAENDLVPNQFKTTEKT